jgi:WD40 repeat protein
VFSVPWKGNRARATARSGSRADAASPLLMLMGPWPSSISRRRASNTPGHPPRAAALCFSPDGALLASSGQLNEKLNSRAEVIIWCTATGARLKRLELEPEGVSQVAFSPDSSTLAISRNLPQDRGRIDVWDLHTGQVRHLADHRSFSLAFTSDGTGLLAAHDAQVRLWDTETGALKVEFGQPAPVSVSISSLVLLPDGRRFVAGKSTGVAEVWAIPEPATPSFRDVKKARP